MAPFVAVAAIVWLASGRLVAGSRAGVVLRPTLTRPPARRSSRCRNLLARERTPIGDTARQLSQKPVELADKLHLQVGFNRPALLNVLVPLNPRHFSDAVNEVQMHIANHAHVHAHDINCTCTCRTSPRRARAAPTAPAGTASSAVATRSATALQHGPKFPWLAAIRAASRRSRGLAACPAPKMESPCRLGCRGEAAAALRCRSNVADSTAFGHPGARERRNAQKGWLSRSATTLYFALWYLLSIGHSVTGKQLTNALPLPWSVAAAQIVVGALFTLCLWLTGLRTPPTGTLGGMARNWPTHPKPTPNPNPNP